MSFRNFFSGFTNFPIFCRNLNILTYRSDHREREYHRVANGPLLDWFLLFFRFFLLLLHCPHWLTPKSFRNRHLCLCITLIDKLNVQVFKAVRIAFGVMEQSENCGFQAVVDLKFNDNSKEAALEAHPGINSSKFLSEINPGYPVREACQ